MYMGEPLHGSLYCGTIAAAKTSEHMSVYPEIHFPVALANFLSLLHPEAHLGMKAKRKSQISGATQVLRIQSLNVNPSCLFSTINYITSK